MTTEGAGGNGANGYASGYQTTTSNRAGGGGGTGRSGAPSSSVTSADGETMIGISPFVSVRTLLAALRRRWHPWVFLALLSLLGGLAVAVFLPPPYTATATLLLAHPSGTDAERAMPTELELLKTRTVAQGAVDQAHLNLSAQDLLAQYDGAVGSDQILTVTATATTAGEAARRADAVAASFLAFRQSQFRQQLQAAVGALQDRVNTLATELSTLDDQVNAYSAAPQKDPVAIRAFGDVLTHRAQLADQISTLQREVDTNRSDTGAVIAGSRVVDKAAGNKRSAAKKFVEYALAGLVLGLVVGVGGIVSHEVISEAVSSRVDTANALGVAVTVSVGAIATPLWGRRRRLPADPTKVPGVALIVRHLRQALDHPPGPQAGLVVATVGGEWPSVVAVAGLARELAAAGRRVRIVDATRASSGPLRQLAAPAPASDGRGAIGVVPAMPGATADTATASDDNEAVIVLANLDPELGALHLRAWASTAVAVVMAGKATPTALQSAAQMLRAAGIDLVSGALVGAARSDETLGVPTRRPSAPAYQPAPAATRTPAPTPAAGTGR
jgi:capsular polysaccharide biosynthesis protein